MEVACYLDGRYFNIVLGDIEGVVDQPLYIRLLNQGKDLYYETSMAYHELDENVEHYFIV